MNQISSSIISTDNACTAAKFASTGLEIAGLEASLFGLYNIGLPTLMLGKTMKVLTEMTCYRLNFNQALLKDSSSDLTHLVHITASYFINQKPHEYHKKSAPKQAAPSDEIKKIGAQIKKLQNQLVNANPNAATKNLRAQAKRAAAKKNIDIQDKINKLSNLLTPLFAQTENPYEPLKFSIQQAPSALVANIKKWGTRAFNSFRVYPFLFIEETLFNKTPPLHYAVKRGDLSDIKELVELGFDINGKAANGDTPLHVAAQMGDPATLQALLALKANPEAHNTAGRTPIHTAITHQNLNAIRELAEAGADLNAKDHIGATPLHRAIYLGDLPILDELIQAGVDMNILDQNGVPPLSIAISLNKLDLIETLLQAGPDVNSKGKSLFTPLHLAVVHAKSLPIVRQLLHAGANVNATSDEDHYSPLFMATAFNNVPIALELINANADVDAINKEGSSILHATIVNEQLEIFHALLQAGANVNARSPAALNLDLPNANEFNGEKNAPNNGLSLLRVAIMETGNMLIIEKLIRAGADLNALDQDELSPLSISISKNNTALAKLLIENKAKLNTLDYRGLSPLFHTLETENQEIINALISAKVDVNTAIPLPPTYEIYYFVIYDLIMAGASTRVLPIPSQNIWDVEGDEAKIIVTEHDKPLLSKTLDNWKKIDKFQLSPLDSCIISQNIQALKSLIKAGADVNALSIGGHSHLQLAIINQNLPIAKELIRAGADVNHINKLGLSTLSFIDKLDAEGYFRFAPGALEEFEEELLEAGAKRIDQRD